MTTVNTTVGQPSEVPGIIVDTRPPEQTARIAGTGIEVYALVRALADLNGDEQALREACHWLSGEQIDAALAYARAHRSAMDARLAAEATIDEDVEELWRKYPHLAPPSH